MSPFLDLRRHTSRTGSLWLGIQNSSAPVRKSFPDGCYLIQDKDGNPQTPVNKQKLEVDNVLKQSGRDPNNKAPRDEYNKKFIEYSSKGLV